ncbi:MAG: hypothetical protein WCL16_14295 [bacterium]
MIAPSQQSTLGARLGLTVHVSAFRIRLEALRKRYPSTTAAALEDWLLDVANRRGARIVVREPPAPENFTPPLYQELTQEELVVAICQLQGQDRPQLLRLAAQFISRGELDFAALALVARRERVGSVLAAMAKEALKVSPGHPCWSFLAKFFATASLPHDVVMHWTRLAEPVMAHGRVNAAGWRLVA